MPHLTWEIIATFKILHSLVLKSHDVWEKSMDEEIISLENNQTWKLVDVPADNDAISVKWIYKKQARCRRKCTKVQGKVSFKRIYTKTWN
jgi:hypothetical protein